MLRSRPGLSVALTLFLGVLLTGCARDVRPAAPQHYGHAPAHAPAEFPRPATQPMFGSAMLWLPGNLARELVHYEVINGFAIFEGDINLGPVSQLAFRYNMPSSLPGVFHAAGTPNDKRLWPGAQIPFAIDASVSSQLRKNIAWAVEHINSRTNLTLRPRTPADKNYINFDDGGSGCWSYVGMTGGSQEVHISGCGKTGIVHEVLHAAGVYHEHSRPDRDAHVVIVWSEIKDGHKSNFKIRSKARTFGAYDYRSIMHYWAKAFSKSGRPTIIPKTPTKVGEAKGLSALDIAGVNALYGNPVPVVPGLPELPGGITPGSLPFPLPTLGGQVPFPSTLPTTLPTTIPTIPGLNVPGLFTAP